jgi:acyl carrier protein
MTMPPFQDPTSTPADARAPSDARPALRQHLRQFIRDNFLLGPQAAQFTDGDSLVDRQIVDSTGFLELITHLEEHFGIRVEDEEMTPENLESLDRMADFLVSKGVHGRA